VAAPRATLTRLAMRPIGFSTGCFIHTPDLSLRDRLATLLDWGCDAVEITLDESAASALQTDSSLYGLIESFGFVSLHAPDLHDYTRRAHWEALLAAVMVRHPIIHADTVHPDRIDPSTLARLSRSRLRFAFENMDSRKASGRTVEEFKAWRASGMSGRYVLDVQHAWEHDSTVDSVSEWLEAFAGGLSHLHASGQKGANHHALVYQADNRSVVERALTMGELGKGTVPIILEGAPLVPDGFADAMRTEIGYIRGLVSG
jgi:hypothetical protein